MICRHCSQDIHQVTVETDNFRVTYWVHAEDGRIVCAIDWAHPTLPPMDNAILRVDHAEP